MVRRIFDVKCVISYEIPACKLTCSYILLNALRFFSVNVIVLRVIWNVLLRLCKYYGLKFVDQVGFAEVALYQECLLSMLRAVMRTYIIFCV